MDAASRHAAARAALAAAGICPQELAEARGRIVRDSSYVFHCGRCQTRLRVFRHCDCDRCELLRDRVICPTCQRAPRFVPE